MQGSARIDELRQKFHENPRRYFAPLANEYRKAGDPEQAIAICRAHLAQQPAHMSGHVVYAQALYDAGRLDESRVVFEKALSLDPDNAIVLRQLGDISRQKGDTGEARHWYTRALDADPHDREIAAYIAELTEPLTEAETEDAATTPADLAEVSAEEPVGATPAHVEAPPDALEVEPEAARAVPEAQLETLEESPESEILLTDFDPVADEPSPLTDLPGFEADEALLAPDESLLAPDDALLAPDEGVEMFADSSSPFVTRTMAELYAKQGYDEQALEVYKKLAAQNPHDREIADRITELSSSDSPPADAFTESDAPETHAPVENETLTEAPAANVADAPPHELTESDGGNQFTEPADDDFDFGFPSDAATPEAQPGEDATPAIEESPASGPPPSAPVHFTETDIGDGDQWDTSTWAAGFDADEVEASQLEDSTLEQSDADAIESPATDAEEVGPVATDTEAIELATADEAEVAAEPAPEVTEPQQPVRHRADASLIAETDRTGDFASRTAPPGVFNDVRDEEGHEEIYRPADEPLAVTPSAESSVFVDRERTPPEPDEVPVPETLPDEVEEEWRPQDSVDDEAEQVPLYAEPAETELDHFVAYSPQTPEEEDLPHYTPVGPTIREFFATLGAYRPPADGPASFTARASVPEIGTEHPSHASAGDYTDEASNPPTPVESPGADEFPLVSDAFADLFPDSPVSEEDSKAAFALSGALSSQPAPPPTSSYTTPQSSAPAIAEPPPPAATQESEEDIRRFREWLDGLGDS